VPEWPETGAAAGLSGDAARRRQYLDRSLDLLRPAPKQGYNDLIVLETEPDLDEVREEAGFRALLTGASGPKG